MITTLLGYMTKFSIFILLTYFIASSNKQLRENKLNTYYNTSNLDYPYTGLNNIGSFKHTPIYYPISLSNDSNSSNTLKANDSNNVKSWNKPTVFAFVHGLVASFTPLPM